MRVKEVWVRRRGGPLLVKFDAPALTLEAAIDRGWDLSLRSGAAPGESHRALLIPRPAEVEYLPTYPLPHAFEVRHRWSGPVYELDSYIGLDRAWWQQAGGMAVWLGSHLERQNAAVAELLAHMPDQVAGEAGQGAADCGGADQGIAESLQ